MSTTWINGMDAARVYGIKGKSIAAAGKMGSVSRRPSGLNNSAHSNRWEYDVDELEAWLIGYREKHGLFPPPVLTERTCLRCGVAFPSEGIGNRLCDTCRAYARNSRHETAGNYVYCDMEAP